MSIQDEPLDLSTTSASTVSFTEEQFQMAFVEMYTQYMNEQIVAMLESMKKENEEENEEPLIVVDDDDDDNEKEEKEAKVVKNLGSGKKKAAGNTPPKRKDRFHEKRCEANARERNRVQQLSKMFDSLRDCLPLQEDLKISKLSTLRVATAYIDFLANILKNQKNEEPKNRLIKELETAKTLRR